MAELRHQARPSHGRPHADERRGFGRRHLAAVLALAVLLALLASTAR